MDVFWVNVLDVLKRTRRVPAWIIYKLQSWYCEGENGEICPIHKAIYLYKHSNLFIIYVDINIPWSKQVCLKHDCFFARQVNTNFVISDSGNHWGRHLSECHSVVLNLQARSSRDCSVLIWSPAKWNVSRSDTNTGTQIVGQAPLLGIGGSKFGTQSPDFERDLYDLGQDHIGTRRAAKLLKFIFDP